MGCEWECEMGLRMGWGHTHTRPASLAHERSGVSERSGQHSVATAAAMLETCAQMPWLGISDLGVP